MRSILRILTATRTLWPHYLGILVCSVLTALAALGTPFVLKYATDAVVQALNGEGQGTWRIILTFAGLYLALELFTTLVTNVGGVLGDVMSQKMRSLLSTRYFHHLLSLPQGYFDRQLTGTVVSRLNRSIAEVTAFLKSVANTFFPTLITTAAVLGIMFWYYWPLALLLLVIYPAYLWLTGLTSRRWQSWEREKNQHVDEAGGRFTEVVSQLRVVRSFGTQVRELVGFAGHFRSTVALTRQQSRYWHRMDVMRRAVLNLVFFAMYLLIFWRTLTRDFSLGDMVLMVQLMAMAAQPVAMLSWIIDTAQRAIGGSREYFEVMALAPDPRAAAALPPGLAQDLERVETRRQDAAASTGIERTVREAARVRPPEPLPDPVVVLDRVDFAYDGEDPVIRDLSLSIRRGEKVAFVGESGGGKSTLMSLLQGLYVPTRGSITVAGLDTAGNHLDRLRAAMGMVFQEASLFSGTIAENIAYARPQATREQIEQAAHEANADAFIRRFAEGYDTLIGERGLKLSGGQKQRIAIARAILKDAPVLILDEATSALDTRSERAVQEALERLMVGRTSLIIAHRLSTISAVDRIVTLERGRIVETGTPAQLAASGGVYAQLLRLQVSSTAEDRRRMQRFGIIG